MTGNGSDRSKVPVAMGRRTHILTGAAIICISACAAYALVLTGHLGLLLDDDGLVTQNRLVHAPDGLYRMWFTTEPTDYWPVTSTSFWLQWRLWGANPAGYHMVSLFLHLIECLLLWRILERLAIPGAFFGALLFAIHPVNVESVAWIAQQKNMLAMLFYLLTVLWYLRADGQTCRWNRWYWLSLAAFLLSMLSKGSVAIVPLVLLLLIWWQRPLNWRDVVNTIPFFAIAGVLTLVNIWFQNHGVEIVLRRVSPLDRLLGAGAVVWFYLDKAILPIDLQFFYPQWQIDAHRLSWWLPLLAALVVSLFLWRKRLAPWGKAMFTAWAYFCICLLPVMGFTDVGYMKYSLVADHYQHLAIIGVIALAAGSAATWQSRYQTTVRDWSIVAAAMLIALLGYLTFQQTELYRDADTLYESSLAYSWMAHSTLGGLELNRGNRELARNHYRRALELNPNDETAQIGMALVLINDGHYEEAIQYARRGVELWPTSPAAHIQLGIALKRTGHAADAIQEYQEAIRLDPESEFAYNNLGVALFDQGQIDQAIENYEYALKIRPYYVDAHNNLAVALLRKGNLEGAIEHSREALRLNPELFTVRETLGRALLRAGKPAEAADQLGQFVAQFPDDFGARKILGRALLSAGKPAEAADQFSQYVALFPGDAEEWSNLAAANNQLGRIDQAISAATKGLAAARAANNHELAAKLEQWIQSVGQRKSRAGANK
ncbi:MAG TPA: tetratricopeptide repeat protein [Pirellulales bacterium]